MKSRAFLIVLILLIGAFSYGKYRTSNAPKPQPTPLPEIAISIAPSSFQMLMNETIINRNLDTKYGYRLKINVEQPQTYLTSLLTDKSQIIYLAPSDFTEIAKSGKDVKMFGVGMRMYCPFLASVSFQASGDEPLKGKKVAIVKKPSGPYAVLEKLMSNNGSSLTDYFRVTETDLLSLPVVLSRGDVDSSNMCNTVSVSKIMNSGKYRIIDTTEQMISRAYPDIGDLPLFGLVARSEWISQNQSLAKAYLSSQSDMLAYLRDNLDASIESVAGPDKLDLASGSATILTGLIRENNFLNFASWTDTVQDISRFTGEDFNQSMFVSL